MSSHSFARLDYPFLGDYKNPATLNHGHSGVRPTGMSSLTLCLSGSDLTIESITSAGTQNHLESHVKSPDGGAAALPFGTRNVTVPNDGRKYLVESVVEGKFGRHNCKLLLTGLPSTTKTVPGGALSNVVVHARSAPPGETQVLVAPSAFGSLDGAVPVQAGGVVTIPVGFNGAACGDLTIFLPTPPAAASPARPVRSTREELPEIEVSITPQPASQQPQLNAGGSSSGFATVVHVSTPGSTETYIELSCSGQVQRATGGSCSLTLDATRTHCVVLSVFTQDQSTRLLRQTIRVPATTSANATTQSPIDIRVDEIGNDRLVSTESATSTIAVGQSTYSGVPGVRIPKTQSATLTIESGSGHRDQHAGFPHSAAALFPSATASVRLHLPTASSVVRNEGDDAAARWVPELSAALNGFRHSEPDLRREIAAIRTPSPHGTTICQYLLDLLGAPVPTLTATASPTGNALLDVQCSAGYRLLTSPVSIDASARSLPLVNGVPVTITLEKAGAAKAQLQLTPPSSDGNRVSDADQFLAQLLEAFLGNPNNRDGLRSSIAALRPRAKDAATLVPLLVSLLLAPAADASAPAAASSPVSPFVRQLFHYLGANRGHPALELVPSLKTLSEQASDDMEKRIADWLADLIQALSTRSPGTGAGNGIVPEVLAVYRAAPNNPRAWRDGWQNNIKPHTDDDRQLLDLLAALAADIAAARAGGAAPPLSYTTQRGALTHIECRGYRLMAAVDQQPPVPIPQGARIPPTGVFSDGVAHSVALHALDDTGLTRATCVVTLDASMCGGEPQPPSGQRRSGDGSAVSIDLEIALLGGDARLVARGSPMHRITCSFLTQQQQQQQQHPDRAMGPPAADATSFGPASAAASAVTSGDGRCDAVFDPSRVGRCRITVCDKNDPTGTVILDQWVTIPQLVAPQLAFAVANGTLRLASLGPVSAGRNWSTHGDQNPTTVVTCIVEGECERTMQAGSSVELPCDRQFAMTVRQYLASAPTHPVSDVSMTLPPFIEPTVLQELVRLLLRIDSETPGNWATIVRLLMDLHGRTRSRILQQLLAVLCNRLLEGDGAQRLRDKYDAILQIMRDTRNAGGLSNGGALYYFRLKGDDPSETKFWN